MLGGLLSMFSGRSRKEEPSESVDVRKLAHNWKPWHGTEKRQPFKGSIPKRPEAVLGHIRIAGSKGFRPAWVVNPAISRRAQRRMD